MAFKFVDFELPIQEPSQAQFNVFNLSYSGIQYISKYDMRAVLFFIDLIQ